MRENVIKTKSFMFAVRVVRLSQYLVETKKEFVMSKQLLRSGTSVGAMVREAELTETKRDFKHKMAIAQKKSMKVYIGLSCSKKHNIYPLNNFKASRRML